MQKTMQNAGNRKLFAPMKKFTAMLIDSPKTLALAAFAAGVIATSGYGAKPDTEGNWIKMPAKAKMMAKNKKYAKYTPLLGNEKIRKKDTAWENWLRLSIKAETWTFEAKLPENFNFYIDAENASFAFHGEIGGKRGNLNEKYQSGLARYDSAESTIKFLCPPGLQNRISISAHYSPDSLVFKIDTIINIKIPPVASSGNIELYALGVNEGGLKSLARLMPTFGEISTWKTRAYAFGDTAAYAKITGYEGGFYEEGQNAIFIDARAMHDPVLSCSVAFHEFAHYYYANSGQYFYDRIGKSTHGISGSGYEVTPFAGAYRDFLIAMKADTTVAQAALTPIIGRYAERQLVKLFSESEYHRSDYGAGHPWSNANELFASTTAILAVFADGFFVRLEKLRETDKEGHDAAKRIAAACVKEWKEWRIFSDDVYKKLGLAIPNTKSLDLGK